MSKSEKLLRRFLGNPPPTGFTWEELINVMSHLGYQVEDGKGSHRAFFNKEKDHYIRGIPKPHPNNEMLVCYLKKIRKDLAEAGVI